MNENQSVGTVVEETEVDDEGVSDSSGSVTGGSPGAPSISGSTSGVNLVQLGPQPVTSQLTTTAGRPTVADIQVAFLRYCFKTQREKGCCWNSFRGSNSCVIYSGSLPTFIIALENLPFSSATLTRFSNDLFYNNLVSKSNAEVATLHSPHHVSTSLLLEWPRSGPEVLNFSPSLLGLNPFGEPNFSLYVDLGRVQVLPPNQHNETAVGTNISALAFSEISLPGGPFAASTEEVEFDPYPRDPSQDQSVQGSSSVRNSSHPRGCRRFLSGRPPKPRLAPRKKARSISVPTDVGCSPGSGAGSGSSGAVHASSPSPGSHSVTPSDYNIITRARRALSLGATVGVVLDCPEEEALASLCEQIASHWPNP